MPIKEDDNFTSSASKRTHHHSTETPLISCKCWLCIIQMKQTEYKNIQFKITRQKPGHALSEISLIKSSWTETHQTEQGCSVIIQHQQVATAEYTSKGCCWMVVWSRLLGGYELLDKPSCRGKTVTWRIGIWIVHSV